MKRLFFLFFCVLFGIWGVGAQEFPQEMGVLDTEKFPEVSFTYTCYERQPLNRGEITLSSESKRIRIDKMELLRNVHTSDPSYTLFLWEDMCVNGRDMDDFVRKTLAEVFRSGEFSARDKFAVATFNRTPAGLSVLNMQTSGFISDRNVLDDRVQQYASSTKTDYEKPAGRADVYRALKEGIALLAEQKGEGARSIVLFTAGNPLEEPVVPGAGSMHDVLAMAKSRHIPIGIMQYHAGRGNVDIGLIADETNGVRWFETGDTKGAAARMLVSTGLARQKDAYWGHTYKITFVAPMERGSDAQTLKFRAGNRVELSCQLVPPPFSMRIWMKENMDLVLCMAILVLVVLGIGIGRICRNARRRNAITKNLQEQIKALGNKIIHIGTSKGTGGGKNVQEEEQKRLRNIMRVKNMYPRLQYMIEGNAKVYIMQKTRISVGRRKGNDLVLSQPTVSGFHCEIFFDGLVFRIVDKNSKNKVVVNGQIQNLCALKNGDVIELGEVVVLFAI